MLSPQMEVLVQLDCEQARGAAPQRMASLSALTALLSRSVASASQASVGSSAAGNGAAVHSTGSGATAADVSSIPAMSRVLRKVSSGSVGASATREARFLQSSPSRVVTEDAADWGVCVSLLTSVCGVCRLPAARSLSGHGARALVAFSCGHAYHDACVTMLAARHVRCPLCDEV
jgi:hypothetical protein